MLWSRGRSRPLEARLDATGRGTFGSPREPAGHLASHQTNWERPWSAPTGYSGRSGSWSVPGIRRWADLLGGLAGRLRPWGYAARGCSHCRFRVAGHAKADLMAVCQGRWYGFLPTAGVDPRKATKLTELLEYCSATWDHMDGVTGSGRSDPERRERTGRSTARSEP